MRYIILYIIFLVMLSTNNLKAQFNYVPNYSFENYDSCPTIFGGIDNCCMHWFTPMAYTIPLPSPPYSINSKGSSDYFNVCSGVSVGIPLNDIGFQYPLTGKAYSGINLIYSGYVDFKEYIEVKLVSRLTKNRKYCISLYYSIANSYKYHPIELGVLLSDTLVSRLPGTNTQQPQNIYANPQVSQQLPQTIDTINWIKVSGSFIAKRGEQYLTIGNFQHTDTLTDKNVYVYIDDVKLYYCGPDTTQEVDEIIIPNVFTPNGDGYNDKFEYKNQEQWKFETQIYSRWGNLVYDNKDSKNWDGYFEGKKVSSGVYFYLIKAVGIRNGEIRIYRGTVTVMY